MSSAESANSSLQEKVKDRDDEVVQLKKERDDLREMTERSSAELRKALEVRGEGGEGEGRVMEVVDCRHIVWYRISRTTREQS